MVGDAIMQSGKIAVAAEVLSMAAGKKEFDVANVLASMASTLTNTALAKVAPNELTKTTLSNLSTTAIDSVAHNNFQVETLAANLLGSAMQYGAQKGIEELSPHYQAALNGETVDKGSLDKAQRNPGNKLPGRNNPDNLPARPEQRRSSLPQNRNRSTIHFDDPGLDDDVMTKKLDVTIHSDDPRWQTIGSQPTPSASGNRSGFWRNPGMMERAVRSANMGNSANPNKNYELYLKNWGEGVNPTTITKEAAEQVERFSHKFLPNYGNLRNSYWNMGVDATHRANEMQSWVRTREDWLRWKGEKVIAGIGFEKSATYGFFDKTLKVTSGVGKLANVFEWHEAIEKIHQAPTTSEAVWVGMREVGGIAAGTAGAIIGGGTSFAGTAPLEVPTFGAATPLVMVASVAGATAGAISFSAGWKTGIDSIHQPWWERESKLENKMR